MLADWDEELNTDERWVVSQGSNGEGGQEGEEGEEEEEKEGRGHLPGALVPPLCHLGGG